MAFFFICTLILSVGHSLYAATINVPEDFITIQGAVDSAISGDTVKVAAGAYTEPVVMKKGVNIEGAGIDVTTIISNSSPATVTGADDAVISGFLLTNLTNGVGFLSDNASPTLTGCRITECVGHGISCTNGGSPVIKNNIIDNNIGRGINCSGVTEINISHNTIFGNRDHGILVSSVVTSTIKNNVVYDNFNGITVQGGGDFDITNNTINENGEGIRIGTGTSIVMNNIVTSNRAGGIVDVSGSSALSFNDVFENGTNYIFTDPGFGDISLDPLFFDASTGDFHFRAASSAIDAGNPVITDPDGSISDLGAFGGPGTLEESTIFGPIVKDIVVSPNPVSQGQPITIRASASAQ